MQKYLNYITAYTFVNIYQDILIFNYYEHFYYENTIYSLCRSGSTPVQLQDHQFMFSEFLPEMTSEQENRQLKEAQTCKICMDKEVRILFLLYFCLEIFFHTCF